MALFRAMESALPVRRRLFDDPLAYQALSGGLRGVALAARIPGVGALLRGYIDRNWPGGRTSGVARTRYIDDQAEAALAAGVEQVVILGAGFDARAYRLEGMRKLPVFEVDHPSTSVAKQAVVRRTIGAPPPQLRFVPVNFDSEPLAEAMRASGYEARRRTLFIWEGVTNYLSEGAVGATLDWCAAAAPGSVLIFTYIHSLVLSQPQAFHGGGKMLSTVRDVGERWTFGIDPAHLEQFLAGHGLRLRQDIGAADYRALHYGIAARDMRGYEFYRIAVAAVDG
jgi:methyltransferase (TIGR00027 family)